MPTVSSRLASMRKAVSRRVSGGRTAGNDQANEPRSQLRRSIDDYRSSQRPAVEHNPFEIELVADPYDVVTEDGH